MSTSYFKRLKRLQYLDELLALHRVNVMRLRDQADKYGGESSCPLSIIDLLSNERGEIANIKLELLQQGEAVEDHPLDTPPIEINLQGFIYASANLQVTATLTATAMEIQQPPKRAEYFLHYLPRKDRDEVIGDLAEEYQTMYKRFGPRGAARWYWWQVVFSFGPFFKTILKNIIKWSTIGWISHLLRLGLDFIKQLGPI